MLTVFCALLTALGALTVIWLVLGLFLCPLGSDGSVSVTIRLHGDAAGLEHSLRALRWLRGSGLLAAQVHLEDEGLTPEGRERVHRALKLDTKGNHLYG